MLLKEWLQRALSWTSKLSSVYIGYEIAKRFILVREEQRVKWLLKSSSKSLSAILIIPCIEKQTDNQWHAHSQMTKPYAELELGLKSTEFVEGWHFILVWWPFIVIIHIISFHCEQSPTANKNALYLSISLECLVLFPKFLSSYSTTWLTTVLN